MLHAEDAENPPVIGIRWPRDHIRCLVRREGDLVVLPDLTQLFARLTNHTGEPVSVH
jgi:purine-binding chemotaxis protein CheW